MGKEIARNKGLSEATAEKIDNAVREILEEAKSRAVKILKDNREKLDLLTSTLIEKETLDDSEIRTLLGFEPLEA